jgi:hypothetical protein
MIFKRKEEEGCKHDFVDISPLVIYNLPRIVAVCNRPGYFPTPIACFPGIGHFFRKVFVPETIVAEINFFEIIVFEIILSEILFAENNVAETTFTEVKDTPTI